MREIWADGFGLLPNAPKEEDVIKVRNALRDLVHDGAYWNGLKRLCALKTEVTIMTNALKLPGFQVKE